jgi:hypothetical protein
MLTGTHMDNVADRVERNRSARGEKSGRAKLTEAQAMEILASPYGNAYLAMVYNVSRDTVKKIRAGKLWKHLERPQKQAA